MLEDTTNQVAETSASTPPRTLPIAEVKVHPIANARSSATDATVLPLSRPLGLPLARTITPAGPSSEASGKKRGHPTKLGPEEHKTIGKLYTEIASDPYTDYSKLCARLAQKWPTDGSVRVLSKEALIRPVRNVGEMFRRLTKTWNQGDVRGTVAEESLFEHVLAHWDHSSSGIIPTKSHLRYFMKEKKT